MAEEIQISINARTLERLIWIVVIVVLAVWLVLTYVNPAMGGSCPAA